MNYCLECKQKFGDKYFIGEIMGIKLYGKEIKRVDDELDFCELCIDKLEESQMKREVQ